MTDFAKKLEERGFVVHCFSTGAEAAAFVAEAVPADKSVGIGGSVTVRDLKIDKLLEEKGCTVYWHWTSADQAETLRLAGRADVYLSSANAIDGNGIVYNIDGTGNRVGALTYGPKTVYIVAGKNKLVEGGAKEAFERIKTQACGKNARRLGLDTPCARMDHCVGSDGCRSKQRICKVTGIMEFPPNGHKVHVVLVDEELGY